MGIPGKDSWGILVRSPKDPKKFLEDPGDILEERLLSDLVQPPTCGEYHRHRSLGASAGLQERHAANVANKTGEPTSGRLHTCTER